MYKCMPTTQAESTRWDDLRATMGAADKHFKGERTHKHADTKHIHTEH
jgi:hypothetical protein